MNKATWFVLFALIAVSCLDKPDCYQLDNSYLVVTFRVLGFGDDIYTVSEISSPGADSIFYGQTALSSFLLPLNPLSERVEYTIKGFDTAGVAQIRVLPVNYRREIQYVSDECSDRYFYSGISVDSTGYDSLRVVNGQPTPSPSTNIEIYRCARTTVMMVAFSAAVELKSVTPDFTGVELPINASKTSVSLNLNPKQDSTSFLFNYPDGNSKRLTVTYTRTDKIFSEKCGRQTFLTELAIDPANTSYAATVTNTAIKDQPVQNIAITP